MVCPLHLPGWMKATGLILFFAAMGAAASAWAAQSSDAPVESSKHTARGFIKQGNRRIKASRRQVADQEKVDDAKWHEAEALAQTLRTESDGWARKNQKVVGVQQFMREAGFPSGRGTIVKSSGWQERGTYNVERYRS